MTGYTRLTVVGGRRKAEMVVPNDEAVGTLIPRLMELLDEQPGPVSRPLTLVRSTGEQLDASLTIVEQKVVDGELVRLLREDAAPPPPEVADVTDVLAESLGARVGLWNPVAKRGTAAVAIGLLAAAAGLTVSRLDVVIPAAVLAIGFGTFVVIALVAGRAGGRWMTTAALSVAIGISAPLALSLAPPLAPADDLRTALITALAVWIAIALALGAGLGKRPAWWGSVIGALLAALPLALLWLGVPALGAVGVTAVVAVVVAGLLPWYAMSSSGLTGLDDQIVDGRRGRREDVLITVTDAYRTLTVATFAVAVPIGITGAVLMSSDNLWAVGLGVAVLIITASRTRAMPLTAQSFALWGAVGIGILFGLLAQPVAPAWLITGLLLIGVVVTVIAGGVLPVAHQRASLRRLGNAVESIAVAALLPVLVGVFGLYAELLGAFS
jgi:type VII secretion integral membrane protein EccD